MSVLSRPEAVEGNEGGKIAALEETRARANDDSVGGNGEGTLHTRRQRQNMGYDCGPSWLA